MYSSAQSLLSLHISKILLHAGVINQEYIMTTEKYFCAARIWELLNGFYGIYEKKPVQELIANRIMRPIDVRKFYLRHKEDKVHFLSDHLQKICEDILSIYHQQKKIIQNLLEIEVIDFEYLDETYHASTSLQEMKNHLKRLDQIYNLPDIRTFVAANFVIWKEVYKTFKDFEAYYYSSTGIKNNKLADLLCINNFSKLLECFQYKEIQDLLQCGFIEPKYLFDCFFDKFPYYQPHVNNKAKVEELINLYEVAAPLIKADVIPFYYCREKMALGKTPNIIKSNLDLIKRVFVDPFTIELIRNEVISTADIGKAHPFHSTDGTVEIFFMRISRALIEIKFTFETKLWLKKLKNAGVINLENIQKLHDKSRSVYPKTIDISPYIFVYLKDLYTIFILPETQELLKAEVIKPEDIRKKYHPNENRLYFHNAERLCEEMKQYKQKPETKAMLEKSADKKAFIARAVQGLFPTMPFDLAKHIGFFLPGKDAITLTQTSSSVRNTAENSNEFKTREGKLYAIRNS